MPIKRAQPGTKGGGNYFRIEVRPSKDFVTFRNHDVGEPGGIQRLAGKRSSGSWADQAWLIDKSMAHVEGSDLVSDHPDAQLILEKLGPVQHLKGDIFKGHPPKRAARKPKARESMKE